MSDGKDIIVDQDSLNFFAGQVTQQLKALEDLGKDQALAMTELRKQGTAAFGELRAAVTIAVGSIKTIEERCQTRIEYCDARFERGEVADDVADDRKFTLRNVFLASGVGGLMTALGLAVGGVI